MQTNLLIHNLLYLVGGATNICIALVVFVNQRKKITSMVITFVLMSLAVAIFQISHLVGVNTFDAVSSKNALMWNLADIFIAIFMTHWFLALVGKTKERKLALSMIYITGISMFVFFLFYPEAFLVDSVPKMYFQFYYEPGIFYFFLPSFFLIVAIYYFYELWIAFKAEKDPVQKNRFRYVLFSIIYAFTLGSTAFLLVFDIHFDPLWSSFFGLYTLPLAYAIIEYELLDIKVFTKRATIFALVMTAVGIAIGFINFVGTYVGSMNPNIPKWLVPTLLSALISASGIFVWRRARQEDIVKYQFVDVVTHRFRSPLVDIRWAADLLKGEVAALSPEGKLALGAIEQAEIKLTELTSILITLENAESKKYIYHWSTFSLFDIVQNSAKEYHEKFLKKNITFTVAPPTDSNVYADLEKMKFVVDILVNNAFHYTPEGGSVNIWFDKIRDNIEMHIKDTGIGISKDESPFIFTKFYRAKNARNVDVEGTGIGLYLANEIIKRNGGKISFDSKGIDHGTTFTISLPRKV